MTAQGAAKPRAKRTKGGAVDQVLTGQEEPGELAPLDAPAPGHNFDGDAEIAVISAALVNAEVWIEISDALRPEQFAVAAHQIIWAAMGRVESQGRPIDKITVADELRRSELLEQIGGIVRLDRLVERAAENLSNITEYAKMIADAALSRDVFSAARQIAIYSADRAHSGEDALAFAEAGVLSIGRTNSTTLTPLAAAVPEVLADLAKVRGSLLLGHSTGLREVDEITAGVQGGQLILIAARPAMGKSALALNMARSIAESSGDAVLFFSYEMSTNELLVRMLATSIGADIHLLRQGRLPQEMERDLSSSAQKLMTLPMLIDDRPPETIGRLRSVVRRTQKRAPIAAVFVDYIQLMSGDRAGGNLNPNQEISDISRGLKLLARELDVPVIGLSQLNRSLEARPNKRPLPSDLRDSGALEQNADTIWFLYRDSVYNNGADASVAELIISKQRQGPTGTVYLNFDARCARFSDKPAGWAPPIDLSGKTGHQAF